MVFDAGEPECPQRQPLILVGIIFRVSGANATVVTPAAMLASADDAPGLEATKVLAHATIHPAALAQPRPVSGRVAPPTGPSRSR